MKRYLSVLLIFAFLFSTIASADEGMWLYNEAPKGKIKAKYGFELTQQWLDHVRLSSVRFNNGGPGSVVSAHRPTVTNYHVGPGRVEAAFTRGPDRSQTRLYGQTQCPG